MTHKMRAQAVELARTDVDDARDICTDLRMPRYLQSDLLYRLAAAESALARL